MKSWQGVVAIAVAMALVACGGANNSTNEENKPVVVEDNGEVTLSEREQILYDKVSAEVTEAEVALDAFEAGEPSNIAKVLNDIRRLQYNYNSKMMNSATVAYCEVLKERIVALKERAKLIGSDGAMVGNSQRMTTAAPRQSTLVEGKQSYPYYLEAGDKLHYELSADNSFTLNIYNADSHSRLKQYKTKSVKDSLTINHSAIYLLEVTTKGRDYVSSSINIEKGAHTSLHRPTVHSEVVECKKGDFGATGVEAIKMSNIFEEPRKFTLRGQIKAAFSGAARAIVAIPVPAGATNILYSLRISTSEQPINSDGEFYENLGHSYRRIDVLNLPVYESTRRSGLIDMILDDNRPIRDEDAYCNLYVFRNQRDAKSFQDGGVAISKLNYDINYSTLGTQSCNGSIPVNNTQTIYLAFENERMRYANYLWVEAVAVVPTMEYYKTEYKIE